MTLHHDRTAGREGRRRVTPGHRKSEREIAGAEDRHRSQRDVPLTQVGARQGLAVRHRGIDPEIKPQTRPDDGSEEPQLPDRTHPFAFDASTRQTGFRTGSFDEAVADIENIGRDGFEEHGAGLG